MISQLAVASLGLWALIAIVEWAKHDTYYRRAAVDGYTDQWHNPSRLR